MPDLNNEKVQSAAENMIASYDNQFNAFSGGIEPGGLRNIHEIKMFICYFLYELNKPVERSIIETSLQADGLVNFFEIGSALSELVSSGNIMLDEADDAEPRYSLTPDGISVVETLNLASTLPKNVCIKALAMAQKLYKRRRNEKEHSVVITPEDGFYKITCKVMEGGRELMSVKLRVMDKHQAEYIKNQFFDDPSAVYESVLSSLFGEQYN